MFILALYFIVFPGRENIGDVLTLCVGMALEMNSLKRELCSRLIADMYGRIIEPQFMEDAFVVLLRQVSVNDNNCVVLPIITV